jgi:hypothetical protein
VIWRNKRGCMLGCLDCDAGGRTYDVKKQWVGGYRAEAIDMKYGVAVANVCLGAHRREYKAVAALIRKVERASNGRPIEAVTGDRKRDGAQLQPRRPPHQAHPRPPGASVPLRPEGVQARARCDTRGAKPPGSAPPALAGP